MTEPALAPGLAATVEVVVGAGDTASAVGSGDVDVLATPRLLALAEQASVAAVAGRLPEGRTSVGTHVELDHLRPSAPGARVSVRAVLTVVDGRTLGFDVAAVHADGDVVARGRVVRAVVGRDRFGARAAPPAGS